MKVASRAEKVSEGVTCLAAFGERLYVGSVDESLLALDCRGGGRLRARVPLGATSVRANAEIVAVNSFANLIHVFARADLSERASFQETAAESWKLELSRTRPLLFTGGMGGKVKAWDLSSGESSSLRVFSEANFVTALRLGLDDRLYAATSEGELAAIAGDLSAKTDLKVGLRSGVRALATTPDPTKLLLASESNQLHVLDLGGEKLLGQRFLEGHTDLVTDLLAFPDSAEFLSCALDKSVKHWDLRSGYIGSFAALEDRRIWAMEFLPETQEVAMGSDGGEVLFFAR